ncbi:MAG: hypothetical protein KF905_13305 [Flavobacteriales bacterium]|nr:hypothetical protein [Flavobacteriales bacterium]
MSKSYRQINIFVSHPFEPKNPTYDLDTFRTKVELLITKAESLVRRDYQDFEIETTYTFSDVFQGLPQQIEAQIRKAHVALVDITESKPNIFFEYGLLYGLNKPVVLMKAEASMVTFPIPADIKDRLPVVYKTMDALVEATVEELATHFKKLIEGDALYSIYLNKLWFPAGVGLVHVVTSSESEKRMQYADPKSENWMLLESLGDRDALLWVMTFMHRNYRSIETPMYAADAFSASIEGNLVVIGGPGEEGGDGNRICKTMMERMNGRVSYSDDCEELLFGGSKYVATREGNKTVKDWGYFARYPNPFNPKSSVVLINGLHTFGVLGAAKAFSDHPSAQSNIRKVLRKFNLDDVRQAAFECFFEVNVHEQDVMCPDIKEDWIFPIEREQ